MQMDEVTQQNAALVEESASASRALQEQANALNQEMAYFNAADGNGQAPTENASSAPKTDGARPANTSVAHNKTNTARQAATPTRTEDKPDDDVANLVAASQQNGNGNAAEWNEF